MVAPILVKHEVAQPIEDRDAVQLLDGLDDVGVVAHHQVCAGFHNLPGHEALVPVRDGVGLRPPVGQYDQHIHLRADGVHRHFQVFLVQAGDAGVF